MENGARERRDGGDGGPNRSTTQRIKEGNGPVPGVHKRTISGSLLSSLSFLKTSAKDGASRAPATNEEEANDGGGESSKRGSSIAQALRQSQGRKRKGSLRKAAMLGTGKLLRERRNSVRASSRPTVNTQMDPESPDDETTPRRFSYENPSLNTSSDSGWPDSKDPSMSPDSNLSLETRERLTPRVLASPVTSPVGPYASTTDDDEGLSFFHPTASGSGSSYSAAQLQPMGTTSSLQRRRSNRSAQHAALTVIHTPADLALDDEWDYSETEWWGWIILIVTWIVFVVGMGSCLGVWSWAWDVGETPYAPPELEDDPTLPITGYYPALMVCTAVMAWVWVVVAWVGMKYFRHAKEG